MNCYDRYLLPHLIHCACGSPPVMKQRAKLIPMAKGRVLEVGMGSGLNLPFYQPDQVELVWGLEPSGAMRHKAAPRVARAPVNVSWLDLPGEAIPLEDNTADTIVLTFTLCTIPDYRTALAQMRRVLKPGGQLLFAEHGLARDASVRKWQNRLDPLWRRFSGGCHLNREIPRLIEEAGFQIQHMQADYLPHTPRFVGYNYVGWAS